ncbi:hypothetical protein L0152_19960 [bacterium]|nr:hypothetical protein [bacterium]
MTQTNSSDSHSALRLYLCGFLILFLELLLIRYLAGTVWNMGYFPNLILMAVFIGMGLGFIFHSYIPDERYSQLIFQLSILMFFGLILFLYFRHPVVPGFTNWLGSLDGEVFFTASPGKSTGWNYFFFLFVFLTVVAIIFMISQKAAKLFRLFSPLKAYTLDILGSCCGILAFMAVSYFQLPAWIWFLVLIPLFLSILGGSFLKRVLPSLILLVAATYFAWKQDTVLLSQRDYKREVQVSWSPYQKVEYISLPRQFIFVNGISHQSMENREFLKKSFYTAPYEYRTQNGLTQTKDVLVIGAGAGNDVAAALLFGASHIDAIEIDPVIARFGKKYHPAHPYDNPRVNLVVDDARAFMTYTNRKYDLIIFALTDSLVKVSPMAQLRLENYIFTKESVRTADALLKDGGILLFYNFYRLPWIEKKIEYMIYEALGHYPIMSGRKKDDFTILISDRNNPGRISSPLEPGLDVPVDDWPFLYLRERGIPTIYLKVIAGLGIFIIGLSFFLYRADKKHGHESEFKFLKWAFFFMGLAFLLLETKSVIQFSLLFGTTWLNNSLVFLAVLIFVLIANHLAASIQKTWLLKVAYIMLLCICLVQLLYPLSNLLRVESVLLRFLLASVLTFLPIFFANLIFSITLNQRPRAEQLFGWNLLGAFAGGALEYTSMLLGYNLLSVIIAISYTVVFIFLVLERRQSKLDYAMVVA